MTSSLTVFGALSNALVGRAPENFQRPHDRGRWWWSIIKEPFTGAWQRNMEQRVENVLAFGAAYSCITLIARDISKLGIKLVEYTSDKIWVETESPAFSPVLRRPNKWQNRINFIQQWIISKLISGNTYVLKARDNRGVVYALYILDPNRVKPLIADNGDVYYELQTDNLSGIDEQVRVPASEIIHDVMTPLYHPLVGVSPLMAAAKSAAHGLIVQDQSSRLFLNNSTPNGILTSDKSIDDDVAKRIKDHWETNFTGENYGRVAVLGNGLKYDKMAFSSTEAQVLELLEWDQVNVCSAFHVPPYKIGVGQMPAYNNIEALNQQYYDQCLQHLIESLELCLDEGLGLVDVQGRKLGVEMDLDGLLRMDTATKVKTYADGVKGGIFTPNEGRLPFDKKPLEGGDTVYMQEQNYSLAALSKRDAKEDPFASASAKKPSAPALPAPASDDDSKALAQLVVWEAKPKAVLAFASVVSNVFAFRKAA